MKFYASILLLFLSSCVSTKHEIKFYVLNPASHMQIISYRNLQIGISSIKLPNYLTQNSLVVFLTPSVNKLLENDQWSGNLDDNIGQVLRTNLSMLFPHAVVQNFPWSAHFDPDYRVNIDINQFYMDVYGNSVLNVTFQITHGNNMHQYAYRFTRKLLALSPLIIVDNMNQQLEKLSYNIAQHMIRSYTI